MALVLNIPVFILLLIIVYQDFRYRAISWIILPLLFVLLFITALLDKDPSFVLKNSLSNFLFVLFQLGLVLIYYWIKNRRFINITDNLVGWGDIFFFLAITPGFSLPIFVLFLITGMLFALIIYFVIYKISNPNLLKNSIPLAGFLAAYLVIIKSFVLIFPDMAQTAGIELISNFL